MRLVTFCRREWLVPQKQEDEPPTATAVQVTEENLDAEWQQWQNAMDLRALQQWQQQQQPPRPNRRTLAAEESDFDYPS